nr:hypothetical protein [Melioribacteraceae bacterium]
MYKNLLTKLLVIFLLPLIVNGQELNKKAQILIDNENTANYTDNKVKGNAESPNTFANYIFVDDMANIYGPAIGTLNPLAYDPWANVLAVVHRGRTTYAQSSGELWWNISTDNGITWIRSNTSVQNNWIPNNARYPSMALYNPFHGSDISDVWAFFSWPQLNPSSFGYLGSGISTDLLISDWAIEDQGPPAYSSQVPCWASDVSPWFFWASDNQVDAGIRIFRTSDWSEIEKIDPPQMNDAVFGSNGNVTCGGVSHNGIQYYGVLGSFDSSMVPNNFVGKGNWGIGYSKSTDNGATWSN